MRLERIRRKLAENNLEAVIVTSFPNIYYLSGFTGTDATLYISQTQCFLLTDFRYIEQAHQEAGHYEIVKIDSDSLPVLGKLAQGMTAIGIEEEDLSYGYFRKLQQSLSWCKLQDGSDLFREMRQIKDEAEISILREAIVITDQAFAQILEKIRPGVTEQEIAIELEFSLRKMGATGRSFDYIVASGKRSALPHGVATSKVISDGEFLTMDFGAKYQGYCSDFTRTVFLGQPESKHKEIYEVVREAQQAGIEAVKPGLSGREVDEVARGVISRAGYGEYFGHGLGHSLGLEIHEKPNLNTRENTILEPGMVLTVEPGIYIPDWGGVRIEDVVLVTKTGAEVLTQAPKQCIIIN